MNLRIKEVLKEKGKTAVWLASEIGIAQPSMSNIVNNKVSPSIETLERIADILKVNVSDFFTEKHAYHLKCPHCGGELNMEIKG